MTSHQERLRREHLAHKYAHQLRSLEALSALQRSLGIAEESTTGHGAEWLQHAPKPVVAVRCPRGHQLAGVWRTDAGPLLVAWPDVTNSQEVRSGRYTVTVGQDPGRRMVVDLIADEDPFASDDQLRVGCRCRGLRPLPRAARAQLADAFNDAVRSRPAYWIFDD